MSDLQGACRKACAEVGIEYRDVSPDGKWHNVPVVGKDTRNDGGRIRIFLDGEGGYVNNWTNGGEPLLFWARSETTLDPAERDARRKRAAELRAKAEEERRKEADEAAKRSGVLWSLAKTITADTPNPYLTRKQVPATPTLRQITTEQVAKTLGYHPKARGEELRGLHLVVPLRNGKRTFVQLIDEAGRKHFIFGSELAGAFWSSERLPDGTGDGLTVAIAEGVATALTITTATGWPCVSAMNCGNMPRVTKELRARYPAARLIVCSDKGNGEAHARRAAEEAGALLVVPEIKGAGTDVNDLQVEAGIAEVARQIQRAAVPLTEESPVLESPRDDLHSTIADAPLVADAKPKPLFISATVFMQQKEQVRRLIGKLIERGYTGQIFGPSGDGKTFVVLDMAMAVAAGLDWSGHHCEKGLVLFFAGEGHHGLKRRIKAWSNHHGNPDLSNFHISQNTITFDAADLRHATDEVKELEEATGQQVALIVIDTLARHLLGDENSTRDMSEFVRAVDGLRSEFPGSTAIIVHHTGNDAEKVGRSRGSSALKAACDFEIQCTKGVLSFTKMKDAEAPTPIEFKLQPVEIGTDEETGEPITSCIVTYGERSIKNRQEGVKLTQTERVIKSMIEVCPGILIGDLRSNYYDKVRAITPEVKTNTLKNAFLRAVQGLTEKEVIGQVDHAVFLQEVKPSHVTKASQNVFCDGVQAVTTVTHPYIGCDVVTLHETSVDTVPDFDF